MGWYPYVLLEHAGQGSFCAEAGGEDTRGKAGFCRTLNLLDTRQEPLGPNYRIIPSNIRVLQESAEVSIFVKPFYPCKLIQYPARCLWYRSSHTPWLQHES